MRFGFIHRVMIDSLATLGILALVTSGKLHPAATLLVLIGLVVGIFLPDRYRQRAFVQLLGVIAPLVALALQVLRFSLGGDPIPIVVEFAAALQVIRLITRRGAAHDHQVILLSLLHLIAGTVLGGGLTYAVALAGFLIFTPGALVLSHLRREVEGNYRQGARDRTGMPVDVPRILRSRRVVGRGFLLFTCSLSLPVFLFSSLLFTIFPRVGFAWLSIPPISPSRMVGFSNRVDLGGVGVIRSDTTLVMRVREDGVDKKKPRPLRKNFYLRGAVFDTYQAGTWTRLGQSIYRPVERGKQVVIRRPPRVTDRSLEIDLKHIDPPVVFVPGEAVALELLSTKRRLHQFSATVTADARGQLRYASVDQEGLRYRAYMPPKGLIFPEKEHAGHLSRYLFLPPGLSSRIQALAREIAEGKTGELEIARAFEKALRKGYTYDLNSPSGGAEDPLEHFLFESKRGHCEFYSTAMAVMLRVVDVPSRNVTGFVGGTYNRFGEFYAIRQGDAHSWVEAYLPERGWIRFDPTPPSSAQPQAATRGLAALFRELYEAASQSWSKNVLGFDMENQIGILRSVKKLFQKGKKKGEFVWEPQWNFRRLALAVAGLVLLVIGFVLWRRGRFKGEEAEAETLRPEARKIIDLYRLLDVALSQKGVPRLPSTPPLAHAETLLGAGHLTGEEAFALTTIYMNVRYGNARFSPDDAQEFRERVRRLRRLQPENSKAA